MGNIEGKKVKESKEKNELTENNAPGPKYASHYAQSQICIGPDRP
jgi:hypothetical protein